MKETFPNCGGGSNLVEAGGRNNMPKMTLENYIQWLMFPHNKQVSLVDLTAQEQPDDIVAANPELKPIDVHEYCSRRGILG